MHIYALYMKEGGKEGKRTTSRKRKVFFFLLRKAVLKNSTQNRQRPYMQFMYHFSSTQALF